MKPRKAGKAEQFPATLKQHVSFVDAEVPYWRRVLRRRVSKKRTLSVRAERTFGWIVVRMAKDYG